MTIKAKITKAVVMASTVSLLAIPAIAGFGPGDGTGNGGVGPKDGTGNGAKKGTCVEIIEKAFDNGYIARGGNGNGQKGPQYRIKSRNTYGPGDGTGNGGVGPKDGTGNGAKKGTCIKS
jgi:hypothetical protein